MCFSLRYTKQKTLFYHDFVIIIVQFDLVTPKGLTEMRLIKCVSMICKTVPCTMSFDIPKIAAGWNPSPFPNNGKNTFVKCWKLTAEETLLLMINNN